MASFTNEGKWTMAKVDLYTEPMQAAASICKEHDFLTAKLFANS